VSSKLALVVKYPPANTGDIGDASLIPGSRRSPGGGHNNSLQNSYLENPHGQKCLSGLTFRFLIHFQLIFVSRINLISLFTNSCPVCPAPIVEETFFPTLCSLVSFVVD